MGNYSFEDSEDGDKPISTQLRERTEKWLQIIERDATTFEWSAVHHRIEIIRGRLAGKRGDFTNRAFAMESRVLREAIDHGLRDQFLYRYPNDKMAVLKSWMKDWASTLEKFPESSKDIHAGVDLWAMGHATASVFHFMRVLEHGIRALAKEVGKDFAIQNWQNILDEIESEIRQLGKTLPRGSTKNERLQFLSEAAKELVYFKDGWRNFVSHNRGSYDEYQARSVMEHVRSFMTVLSSRLGDDPQSS